MVVDSAAPDEVNPVALEYFDEIGVDPASDVCLIVATHFDSDHIRGLDSLVAACPRAAFCTTNAFKDRRMQALMNLSPPPAPAPARTSPLGVLRGVREALSARDPGSGEIAFGGVNVTLYPPHGGHSGPYVMALSPSASTVNDLVRVLFRESTPRRPLPEMDTNPISIVLWIVADERRVLLGGDLPRTGNAATGWSAIVARGPVDKTPATLFKVAHHGSSKSDDEAIWTSLLVEDPVAVVTPKSSSGLPRATDRARILRRAGRAFIAGTAPSPASCLPPDIEWLVRYNTAARSGMVGPMGQVRARAPAAGQAAWVIERSEHAGAL